MTNRSNKPLAAPPGRRGLTVRGEAVLINALIVAVCGVLMIAIHYGLIRG